ncbi:MAG TPA: hypothetical protein DDW52_25555 [Planctomycetaceae bacterium]|nr:hypothetical protein [Planctomycetaceae bacterium]
MPKNLVICCDGTSNDVTGNPTNVLKLFRMLRRDDSQLTYYSPGVGTVSDPTTKTGIGKWISRRIDLGFGLSLRENVCSIYQFIASHYQPGDQIYLFGFSRGGYTVRAVAGMIEFLGLLRPEQSGMERHAWSIYADDDGRLTTSERFKAGRRFASAFTIYPKPQIHFLGAWDTVSSFGWLWNMRTLPHTSNNASIRHVRHAVSLDERRAMFQQNLCRQNPANKTFEQVWFAGGHGDVGGGWPEEHSYLSKVAFKWMLDAATEHGLLLQRKNYFRYWNRTKTTNHPPEPPRPNDALRGGWWLVELAPRRMWDPKSRRLRWTRPHLARRRRLPFGAAVHCSVGDLMQRNPAYRPPEMHAD